MRGRGFRWTAGLRPALASFIARHIGAGWQGRPEAGGSEKGRIGQVRADPA